MKRKRRGYWTEETILKELRPLVRSLRHWPTQDEFKQLGMANLRGAIHKYGNAAKFRLMLKVDLKKAIFAKDGHCLGSGLECYVDDFLYEHGIAHEVQPLIVKTRKFRADFKVGEYWIEVLGYKDNGRQPLYFTAWAEKRAIYKRLRRKLIIFTAADFADKTYSEIMQIIAAKLPFKNYRRKMIKALNPGEEFKSRYYWEDWDRLKAALLPIAKELGRFPGERELLARGLGGLDRAFYKYDGGRFKIAERLGYPLKKKHPDYWTKERVISELQTLTRKLGRFPSHKDMQKSNYTLSIRVVELGGIDKLRRRFGYEKAVGDKGYWTETAVIKHLKELTKKLGHFPTVQEIGKEMSSLAVYMTKYGGANKFRRLLGAPVLQQDDNYWSKPVVFKHLKTLSTELGHFPTIKEMKDPPGLYSGLLKFGSINKFRKSLGAPILLKEHGYWTEAAVVKHLKAFIAKLGHFPISRELQSETSLFHYVFKFGGIKKFRKQLGYKKGVVVEAERLLLV